MSSELSKELGYHRAPEDLDKFQADVISLSTPQLLSRLNAERKRGWNRPRGDLRQWTRLLWRLHSVLDDATTVTGSTDRLMFADRKEEENLCDIIDFYTFLITHCTSRSTVQSDARLIAFALNCYNIRIKLSAMRFFAEYGQWLKGDDVKVAIGRHIAAWIRAIPTNDLVEFVNRKDQPPPAKFKTNTTVFDTPMVMMGPQVEEYANKDDVRLGALYAKMHGRDAYHGTTVTDTSDVSQIQYLMAKYAVELSSTSRERRIQLVELQTQALTAGLEVLEGTDLLELIFDFDAPWQSVAAVVRVGDELPAALRLTMLRAIELLFRMLARSDQSPSKYLVTLGFPQLIPAALDRSRATGDYDEPTQLFKCLAYMPGRHIVASGLIPTLLDLVTANPGDDAMLRMKSTILEVLHNVAIDVPSVVDVVFTPHNATARLCATTDAQLDIAQDSHETRPDWSGADYAIGYARAMFIKSLLVLCKNMLSYRYTSEFLAELLNSALLNQLTRIVVDMPRVLGSRITCFACQIFARLDDVEQVLLPKLEQTQLLPRLLAAVPKLVQSPVAYTEAATMLITALRYKIDEKTKKKYLQTLLKTIEQSDFEDDAVWAYPLPPTYFDFVDDYSWVVGHVERITAKFLEWDNKYAQTWYVLPWERGSNKKLVRDMTETITATLRSVLCYVNDLATHTPALALLASNSSNMKTLYQCVMELLSTPAAAVAGDSLSRIETDHQHWLSADEQIDVLAGLAERAIKTDMRANLVSYDPRIMLVLNHIDTHLLDNLCVAPKSFAAKVTKPLAALVWALIDARQFDHVTDIVAFWKTITTPDTGMLAQLESFWQREATAFYNAVYDLVADRLQKFTQKFAVRHYFEDTERTLQNLMFEYLETVVDACQEAYLEDVCAYMFKHKKAPLMHTCIGMVMCTERMPPSPEEGFVTPEEIFRPVVAYLQNSINGPNVNQVCSGFCAVLQTSNIPANTLEDLWLLPAGNRQVAKFCVAKLFDSGLSSRAKMNIINCIWMESYADPENELVPVIDDWPAFKRKLFSKYKNDLKTRESVIMVDRLFAMKGGAAWCDEGEMTAYATKLAIGIAGYRLPSSHYMIDITALRLLQAHFDALRDVVIELVKRFDATDVYRERHTLVPAAVQSIVPKLAAIANHDAHGELRLPHRIEREQQRTLWVHMAELTAALATVSVDMKQNIVSSKLLSLLRQTHEMYDVIGPLDLLGTAVQEITKAVVLDDATIAQNVTAAFTKEHNLVAALQLMKPAVNVRPDIITRVALLGKLEIGGERARLTQTPDLDRFKTLPATVLQALVIDLTAEVMHSVDAKPFRPHDGAQLGLGLLMNCTKISLPVREAVAASGRRIRALVRFYLETAVKRLFDGASTAHGDDEPSLLDDLMQAGDEHDLMQLVKDGLESFHYQEQPFHLTAAGTLINLATPISTQYVVDGPQRWASFHKTAKLVLDAIKQELTQILARPANVWGDVPVYMLHAAVDLLRAILEQGTTTQEETTNGQCEMQKLVDESGLWEFVLDKAANANALSPEVTQMWGCVVSLIAQHRERFWGPAPVNETDVQLIQGQHYFEIHDDLSRDDVRDESSLFRHSALANLESDNDESSEQESAMELEEIADHASDDEPASEWETESDGDESVDVMSIDIADSDDDDMWETTSGSEMDFSDTAASPQLGPVEESPVPSRPTHEEPTRRITLTELLDAYEDDDSDDQPVIRNIPESSADMLRPEWRSEGTENVRALLDLAEVDLEANAPKKSATRVSIQSPGPCGLWEDVRFKTNRPFSGVGGFSDLFDHKWYDVRSRVVMMRDILVERLGDDTNTDNWTTPKEEPATLAPVKPDTVRVMLDTLLAGVPRNMVPELGTRQLADLVMVSQFLPNNEGVSHVFDVSIPKAKEARNEKKDPARAALTTVRWLECIRQMVEDRPLSVKLLLQKQRLPQITGVLNWLLKIDMSEAVTEVVKTAVAMLFFLRQPAIGASEADQNAFVDILIRSMDSSHCTSRVFRRVIKSLAKHEPGVEIVSYAKKLVTAVSADIDNHDAKLAHDQAALLRLMTALEMLYGHTNRLCALYASMNLFPLWERLNTYLSSKKSQDVALLPLVEMLALVVFSTDKAEKDNEFAQRTKEFMLGFGKNHRDMINEVIRHNLRLLRGNLGILARDHHILDFDIKQAHFHKLLAQRTRNNGDSELFLAVHRDSVFHDSYEPMIDMFYGNDDEIAELTSSNFVVEFVGEEAIDEGGVAREWLDLVCKELMSPSAGLFVPTVPGAAVYQIAPLLKSEDELNQINHFVFAGMILGRAMLDKRPVGIYFSRVVYKALLGRKVTLDDMEAVDENYYKSLRWMLENDITDVITETFTSTSVGSDGASSTVELVPNGENIPVTEANKHDYVRLVVEWKLVKSVEKQTSALVNGFHEFIPAQLIEFFDENDLELLICGLPTINVADWRSNTQYKNYTASSPQIKWFWEVVENSFGQEERAKLLQFATGTSRVPALGFAHLESAGGPGRFSIEREFGDTNRLPSSHTCSNQLVLPAYESKEKLHKLLFKAVNEGATGFGFI